jgi:CsoR family transcriptional regulator, copper-sensing transcriptional repressor
MKEKIKNHCCDNKKSAVHPSHKKHLSRLNRASGQLEGVRKMIDEQRYCPEILTQLRAVRSALSSLESEILRTHLVYCVTETLSSHDDSERSKKIEELIDIFNRFK